MKFIFLPLVFFSLFWLALSGHYTAIVLGLGAASCIWVALISKRMDIADHEGRPLQNISFRILAYYVWLGKEILVSSVILTRMILSPTVKLQPAVATLPTDDMNDLEKVIYANSITLTPGTLTIEVHDDALEVHTVRADLLEPLQRGVMADRIRRISNQTGSGS